MRVLIVGGVPGKAYELPEWTEGVAAAVSAAPGADARALPEKFISALTAFLADVPVPGLDWPPSGRSAAW